MKIFRRGYIGVFDSGFGGINILRGIVKKLPRYNYIYLGDTARAPYGSRSQETVYRFSVRAIDFLFAHGCELIVVACNTVSSDALKKIQQEYLPRHYPQKRVIGVLVPTAETAISKTKNKKIGVIATEATVRSGAFEREIHKINPTVQVYSQACPLLVPLIESGEKNKEIINSILRRYLQPFNRLHIDTLVLGCTHYGLLKKEIKKIIDSNIVVLSEADIIPEKLRSYLQRHPEIENKILNNGIVRFYSTDLTERFMLLGSSFFGKKIKVNTVLLD